jgi:hypothetical protein
VSAQAASSSHAGTAVAAASTAGTAAAAAANGEHNRAATQKTEHTQKKPAAQAGRSTAVSKSGGPAVPKLSQHAHALTQQLQEALHNVAAGNEATSSV